MNKNTKYYVLTAAIAMLGAVSCDKSGNDTALTADSSAITFSASLPQTKAILHADNGQIHQRFLLPALLQFYNHRVTTREGSHEKKTWSNIVYREVLMQISFPDYFLNRLREYLNRERDAFIVRD